jgi:hypothetical protein
VLQSGVSRVAFLLRHVACRFSTEVTSEEVTVEKRSAIRLCATVRSVACRISSQVPSENRISMRLWARVRSVACLISSESSALFNCLQLHFHPTSSQRLTELSARILRVVQRAIGASG